MKILDIQTREREVGEHPPGYPTIVYFLPQDIRPEKAVEQYQTALPHILSQLELDPHTETYWSPRAGCPCGCSPGFILEDIKGLDFDIYVSVVFQERESTE